MYHNGHVPVALGEHLHSPHPTAGRQAGQPSPAHAQKEREAKRSEAKEKSSQVKAQLTQLGLPISNLTATRILETSPTASFTLLLSSSSSSASVPFIVQRHISAASAPTATIKVSTMSLDLIQSHRGQRETLDTVLRIQGSRSP
ncbi:hypothetical protein N8I77_001045 [Diaporthe amygdali]|uniref:Uncharacterized protein n=1 Tax=Phomopsis amygdali TaxID=1214568 RepID=A0AAD9SRA0_PHOAM|nr:hypothetical protein N8I77_001045 [Diaporthe amygdali]